MKYFYHLIIVIFFINSTSYTQNRNIIIKGNVVDSKSNNGIEFANISLYKVKDSSILTGCASGKDGEFIIPNIPTGKYYMKINFVGYKTKTIPDIIISNSQKEVSLGKIIVEESTILMNETEVTGRRQLVEYHLDKKVINVKQDISSTSNTALEIMQNQPSVQTDAKGDILLRGSSNFTILVDGRPSILQGSDALRQIPANIIDNIELITNPSAKYDAEGAAGIINIITKKKSTSFFSGAVNVGIGTESRKNGDFNVSYKNNGFSLTAGGDYREQPNRTTQDIKRETFGYNESTYNNSFLNDNRNRKVYNFRLGLEYNIDNKNNIAVNTLYGDNKVDLEQIFHVNEYSLLSNIFSYIKDNLFTESKYYSASINFNHKFTPNINDLTAEFVYMNIDLPLNESNNDYISNNNFSNLSQQPKKRYFDDKSGIDRYRFKLNYTQKIDSNSIFESGFQANLFYKNMDVTNKVFDWGTNLWEITTDITNRLDFRNNIYAAFATYSGKLYDFNYQIGLRAEVTDRILNQLTMNKEYDYNHLHLFPSIFVSKKIGKTQSFQCSYSRRINRPNETFLNPYSSYSDSYTTNYGNPNLKPETIDSYEINYQNSFDGMSFSIQTYLRSSNNSISQIFKIDELKRIAITNENYDNITNSGVEISANYTAFNFLQLQPSLNIFNRSRKGEIETIKIDDNNFTWSSRLNSVIFLSANTQIQFVANYFSKQYLQQTIVNPLWVFNGGVRQAFFDRKLTLTLQASNLFKLTQEVYLDGQKFRASDLIKMDKNIVNLTLSFNFNNFKQSKTIPDIDVNVNDR